MKNTFKKNRVSDAPRGKKSAEAYFLNRDSVVLPPADIGLITFDLNHIAICHPRRETKIIVTGDNAGTRIGEPHGLCKEKQGME